MKRDIYNRLKEWKLSERRKPLIMYGARQVGKTYIIKEFGSHEFDNMVYVNCYKDETIAQLFQGDVNIERILIGLSAFAKQSITPGKTLVFLDEIQEIPPYCLRSNTFARISRSFISSWQAPCVV